MQYTAENPDHYITQIPSERQETMIRLRKTLIQNLPKGFEEQVIYNMIGYVVPLSAYPAGYHCDPKLPLSFVAIASQKNFIALYHMGIYSDKNLYDWFISEYPKHAKTKLDMGKSCIRFKKMDDIPFDLIAELAKKMTPEQWITLYESILKR